MNINKNGYKIDFASNTLYINYKFASAATRYGTKEYNCIQDIRKDFPGIKIQTCTGRKTTTCNASKNMTYINMEKYISVQKNANELMKAYMIAKEESKNKPSPYAFVRNWFVTQFPNYKECKIFDGNKIIPFAETAPKEGQEIA